jgi:hypothetical protein
MYRPMDTRAALLMLLMLLMMYRPMDTRAALLLMLMMYRPMDTRAALLLLLLLLLPSVGVRALGGSISSISSSIAVVAIDAAGE